MSEELWSAFEAALRKIERPGPEPVLRERCLPGPPAGRPTRVLLVDDEPNIRRLIRVQLSGRGYEVLEAAEGREALEKVRSDRPDIVLLDVMMPELDGLQVLDILKGDPRTAEIVVVMLTARGSDDHIRHGWKRGADLYLTKPFNPEELRRTLDRLAAVLGTPENPPPLRTGEK
jgi:two-component system alkaline phosphatase synthesis response regulator PhoP/two-component system response regulator VicR